MKLLSLSNTDKGIKGEYFNENFEKRVPFYIGAFTPDLQDLWNMININLNDLINLFSTIGDGYSHFVITKIEYKSKEKKNIFLGTCRKTLHSFSDASSFSIDSEISVETLQKEKDTPKGKYLKLCNELGAMVDLLLNSFEPNAYVDILPIDTVEERNLFSDYPKSASNE